MIPLADFRNSSTDIEHRSIAKTVGRDDATASREPRKTLKMQFKQSLSLLLLGVLPQMIPQPVLASGRPSCASPSVSQATTTPTQYAAPVTQYSAPVATQYAAPVAMHFTPVVTHYAAPVVTQYAAPIAAHYVAPVTTQYAAPVSMQFTPVATHYAAPTVAQYAAPVATHYFTPTVSQPVVTHSVTATAPAFSTATRQVYQQASPATVNQQSLPLLSLLMGGLNLASNLDPATHDQQVLNDIGVALQNLQTTISNRNIPSNTPSGQGVLANRVTTIEDYLTAQPGSTFKPFASTRVNNQQQAASGPISQNFEGARSGTPIQQTSPATNSSTSDLSTKVSDLTLEIRALTAAVKELTEKLPTK